VRYKMKKAILMLLATALLVAACDECKEIGESCSSDEDCCSGRCGNVEGEGKVCMYDD